MWLAGAGCNDPMQALPSYGLSVLPGADNYYGSELTYRLSHTVVACQCNEMLLRVGSSD